MPTAITFGSVAARAFGFLGRVLRKDAFFNYVTMLLPGNGTNGAQNNTFLDSSTNNFTITRNGNTTQGTFSPYGANWSNYFDGTGDYLSIAAATAIDLASSNFTIEVWAFPTVQTNAVDSVFGYGNFTTMLYRNGTTWSWEVGDGSSANYFTITATCTPNTWQHIALTRSGNTFTFWINGVSAGTNTTANAVGTSSKTLTVGWNNGTASTQYFTGYISNFRIVKGTAVYTAAFTPPTAPLTAITNTSLLTCQSNRFIDNSSNNFTITRNGDVSVQRFSPFAPSAAYDSGVIGGSAYFDGSGDYLDIADNVAFSLGTNNFTIELWLYQTANNISYYISQNNNNASTSAFDININNLGVSATIYYGSSFIAVTGGTITLNSWNHVAVSRSGSNMSLYLNGTRVATSASANVTVNDSSTSVRVSGINNATPYNITGYISSARIVNGTAVYDPTQTTITVPTAPLTAITNTSLLLNMTNGGIIDNAMMNDLETVGNAQISTSVKKYGTGSMYFDGSGDYLVSPNSPQFSLGSGNFTIECWANFSASVSGDSYALVVKGSSSFASQSSFAFFRESGNKLRLTFSVDGGNTNVGLISTSNNFLPTTGVWYHLAVVRSGTTFYLFIDGVSQSVSASYFGTATSSSAIFDSTTALTVGSASDATWFFNGYIDDLRITKGVARYTANFTPPTAAFPTQ